MKDWRSRGWQINKKTGRYRVRGVYLKYRIERLWYEMNGVPRDVRLDFLRDYHHVIDENKIYDFRGYFELKKLFEEDVVINRMRSVI